MPINAPQEYYDLELKYSREKNLDERKKILQQMMRVLPKHKGTDKAFAFLKRKMSLLKKEMSYSPQVHKTISIRKRWPRVCLVGYEPESILKKFNLTKVATIYHGIIRISDMKIQLLLVPNFEKYKEFVNSSEVVISKNKIEDVKVFEVVAESPDVDSSIKSYGIIGVYTEKSDEAVPIMKGDTVYDLAKTLGLKTGKDGYAVVYGKNLKFQGQRVGLKYKLNDGDRVSVKA